MSDDLPDDPGTAFRRIPDAHPVEPIWHRHLPPLVWIIPLVAALIGGWIGLQAWLAQGPEISISFHTATGIEPGKTRIRYKDVDIGRVTAVRFTDDDGHILVTAAISKNARRFLRADSRFWVVRPRISAAGVSGIDTLLSGAYISLAAGKAEKAAYEFVGLEKPPILTEDAPGREFVLRARDAGSLDVGAPLLFRRVRAGQVVATQVDDDGHGITLRVFVEAPYDRFVTADTRFWQASGVDVSLDAAGVKISTQSVVSLLEGGVAFEAPEGNPPAPLAEPGARFSLFSDREQAMKRPYTEVRPVVAYFRESLRGLSPGAPVDFRGIVIGEVRRFGIEYDRNGGIFRFPVEIDIYPERLRERYGSDAARADDSTEAAHRLLIDRLVAAGMRAQLRTGNLLTGQLYVALDFFPKAGPIKVDWSTARPEMPTVPGGLAALQDTIGDIASKLDKLPIEQLGTQLMQTMRGVDSTLRSTTALIERLNADVAPEAKAALADARSAMQAAQSTMAQDSPLQSDLHEALKQLSRSARALAELSDYLERHPEALIRGRSDGEAP